MTAPAPHSQPVGDEARHTATPWRVFTNPDGTKLVGIGGLDGEGILDCGFGVWAWNDPEGIANANLVVDAVNNYAALRSRVEELTKALEQIASGTKDECYPFRAMPREEMTRIAGAAISKSCGAESNRHSGAVGAEKRAEQSNPGGGHEVTEHDAQKPYEQKPAGMNPRPAGVAVSLEDRK